MQRRIQCVLLFVAVFRPATGQVVIDARTAVRRFEGIGAISGGGGNSRLLYDYPEPYRSEILDYLFKPGYGASLQILKVEIGGDANSTSGAEPSHMHSIGDEDYNRGYEWWLMEQAKIRNPNIKLAALEWVAPGWIGNGLNFWSQDNIDYIVKWIQGAKVHHGLTIDYVGGWNECYIGWNLAWFKTLKRALASSGLPTQIIGPDEYWAHLSPPARATISDLGFYDDIDIAGAHYPCDFGAVTRCSSFPVITGLDKPMWATESSDETSNIVRSTNLMYIDGRMTASLIWPLVGSIYRNFPWPFHGIILAGEPWSGRYAVSPRVWAIAHTTQFAQPGWRYVDSAVGRLSTGNSGSFVTLVSPGERDYSMIVETLLATQSQVFTFSVAGGLPDGPAHVWSSNVLSSDLAEWFVRQPDLTGAAGRYEITLEPGSLYSITTTTGQGKGEPSTPRVHRSPFLRMPYFDDFEEYDVGRQARLLADVSGAFEIQPCGGGRQGRCVRQMANVTPYFWWVAPQARKASTPYTLIGDPNWSDYRVRVDFLLEQPGTIEILGCVTYQNYSDPSLVMAYLLQIDDRGEWSISRGHADRPQTTLVNGKRSAIGTNSWHTATLKLSDGSITAEIDGQFVGSVNDATYAVGQVGLGVKNWVNAQFDNLRIEPLWRRQGR